MNRDSFEAFLRYSDKTGSGKVTSYLRALDLLSEMIRVEPMGFGDCEKIWEVTDELRIEKLYSLVLQERSKGKDSDWTIPGLPESYLHNGYCSAALRSYLDFLRSGKKSAPKFSSSFYRNIASFFTTKKHSKSNLEIFSLLSDQGQTIDAKIHLGKGVYGPSIVLESRDKWRNTQYNEALNYILKRLGASNVFEIHSIFLASNTLKARSLSFDDLLFRIPDCPYPIPLNPELDFDNLRKRICKAGAGVAHDPNRKSQGNRTRRILINLNSFTKYSLRDVRNLLLHGSPPLEKAAKTLGASTTEGTRKTNSQVPQEEIHSTRDNDLDLGDLKELQLSNKARRCLRRGGIDSIEKLEQVSDEQLLSTPWTGEGTVRSIRDALSLYYKRRDKSFADNRKEKNLDELYASPINEVLNLSARAKNCLRHIATIGDLRARTYEELGEIRGMGKGTLREINEKLSDCLSGAPSDKETASDQISKKGLHSYSIDVLNLSVRARNCLKNIYSIGELAEMSRADLAAIRNMGRSTIHEIETKLAEFISKINDENISNDENNSDQQFCFYARSVACNIDKKISPGFASLERWKAIITSKDYLGIPIKDVCSLAGAKWPQKKSAYSDMAIGELIDFSTNELLGKRGFGKKKVVEYYKALAFLASGLWHENVSLDPVEKVEGILRDFPGLSKIEREILELRVGKEGPPQTLENIGSQKKVTRERIRQIEKSALKKIRTESNLEAFNQFLTDREKEIWYLLGGVDGTIKETARFDELAESLPFNFRLCIQVYTGSKVSGERFPNVLRAFLTNRYKFAGGYWYNVPIDPFEIEILIDLILSEFSEDFPFHSHENLIQKLAKFEVEKLEYALSMAKDINRYNGFWTNKSLGPRIRRALNLLSILQDMNAASYPVNLGEIWNRYSTKYENDPCRPRDLSIVLLDYKRYFLKIGSLGWMLLNESNSRNLSSDEIVKERVSNYSYNLTPSGLSIKDCLENWGVLGVEEICKKTFESTGVTIPIGSATRYLVDEPIFIRAAPGLWCLSDHGNQLHLMLGVSERILVDIQIKTFVFSRYAGISREIFPLWHIDMEEKFLSWALKNSHDLYEALLCVIDPKLWNIEPSREVLDKLDSAKFPYEMEIPDFKKYGPPSFKEILGCLVYAKKEQSFSWMASNLVRGDRLFFPPGFYNLLILALLRVIECPDQWIKPHSIRCDPSDLILLLKDAYLENPEIEWDNGLRDIILPRLKKGIEDGVLEQGWLSSIKLEDLACFEK